uniref:AAA family ATPase n=1 Tax=Salmonella sp. SAL4458 TaxID=3159913 RepID=UPI0039786F7D
VEPRVSRIFLAGPTTHEVGIGYRYLKEAMNERASQLAQALRTELQKALIGQGAVIDDVLTALLAGGHVLVEGVPGLGKTLLVRALARCFDGGFARIQFTPDLMPSDVTGHAVYD